jgi:hypothetical protein
MNWKFFGGACILAAGLMMKYGAPLPAVALGIALAGFLTWKMQRAAAPTAKKK